MTVLGNGLFDAKHHEAALSVKEAELAMKRRVGIRIRNAQRAEQSCKHL